MILTDEEEQWACKHKTESGDLYSAIMCYWRRNLEGENSMSNLDRFLEAIKPDSGWVEDADYNPQRKTVRDSYDRDFYLLHRKTEE